MAARKAPTAPAIRYSVAPGDVPPEKAARRLHLTLAEFDAVKERLFARKFPRPDPDTGNYDLEAVDRWRKLRIGVKHLFPELTEADPPKDPEPKKGLGERFRDVQERGRQAQDGRRHG